ncbi:MAG: DUF1801 domain-containing protein [Hyphomicrobiaceae bacterium]
MAKSVDDWFDAQGSEHKPMLADLRDIVLSTGPDFVEEIKWGGPCYTRNALVCYIRAAKGHVTLGFYKGAELDDPDGLLEGGGKVLRHVKVTLGDKVPKRALVTLVKAAVRLDGAG